jgi:superfamily II DNA or RNA helicase/HKD family nuclease/diadenosine tetraphosphate (Ap4A) HIT family hydrolase
VDCPFDDPLPARVFYEDDLVRCLWDAYPVSEGHALVITRRHVATWFDATGEEQAALVRGIEQARQAISARFRPHGFNIGINVHEAAGQTIFHVHVHVIPRYWGDVSDPRGGVRYVIPDLANYVVKDVPAPPYIARPTLARNLSTGPANPLLPRLITDLASASEVDIAVAFVMNSGAGMIAPHIQNFLDRGGRARVLTGDYLNVTDPLGLSKLLDLAGDREVRIYQTRQEQSFHLKAYIFRFVDGSGRAYIGSSNLSRSALQDGLEWNYRVVSSGAGADFGDICCQFNDLFNDPQSTQVDDDWINSYRNRRPKDVLKVPETVTPELPPEAATPHGVQAEALQALEASRAAGNSAGLVVLATGLGKTWLSAFDSAGSGFNRVLFVAHREEILNQAVATFRRIRPEAKLGRFNGAEKVPDADVLFASIQTLGRIPHLRTFARDAFDYVIVDEFHHAAARTYRNLINHFEPNFLLGLTATPERTDGGDLLGLCQENLIYTCDLFEGIERGLLSPFRYFGVPDSVDYQNIPWRSSRFDPEILDQAVATEARAQNALEQWEKRGGDRTLAFCCSMRHADYTAEFFRAHGVNAVAVHSGSDSAPRAASLQQLEKGEIQVLCAVDMFNEGVDVPSIDTVLMLRPTESAILWTQQVGRGLRRAKGKDRLTVIDYIGNHRIFLTKVRTLLGTGSSDSEIRLALSRITEGSFQLPEGCEVTYDLEALKTIESLIRPQPPRPVETYYRDFRERVGVRPSALEAFHEGYNPRQSGRDRWLELVRDLGDLSGEVGAAYNEHKLFLEALEITPMTKSFKMLVLLGALNEDAFPGEIGIEQLTQAVRKIAARSSELRAEFGDAFDDDQALKRVLEQNPIVAWTGGQGTGGRRYFSYERGRFSTAFAVAPTHRTVLQDLVRELAEWRLADYQTRLGLEVRDDQFTCKVFHSGGIPILKLPDRDKHPHLPLGWVPISTSEGEYEANFVKIAVNVIRAKDGAANLLAQILRKWFGPDAGLPGTNFRVVFSADGPGYHMSPQNQPTVAADGARVGRAYSREQIPGLFGLSFSPMQWNQGFIPTPKHVFLLVTLDKSNMAEAHRYQDHFEAADHFAWQSQNRTRQQSRHGQIIRHHAEQGITVHLFVRKQSKVGQRAAPFTYCGEVEFVSWEGEKPISVQWRLQTPLSTRLLTDFARIEKS